MLNRRRLLAAIPAVACMALPAALRAEDRPIGRVTVLVGTAQVHDDRGERRLEPGHKIQGNERLVTAANSRVVLELEDGSRIVVGGDTDCLMKHVIPPAAARKSDGLLIVGKGVVRLILRPEQDWGGFGAQGETALASVRGTDFLIEASADNTAFFVVEGKVSVSGLAGGFVTLAAGEGSDTPRGAPPSDAKRWGSGRVDALLARVALPA